MIETILVNGLATQRDINQRYLYTINVISTRTRMVLNYFEPIKGISQSRFILFLSNSTLSMSFSTFSVRKVDKNGSLYGQ